VVSRDANALKLVEPKTILSVEQVHAQWIDSQLDWLPNAHRLCRAEALGELATATVSTSTSRLTIGPPKSNDS
jgi:hypothetical protein